MTGAPHPYALGDVVRIVDGAFASFAGVVRELGAAGDQMVVEVTMLGRPTPIWTTARQVMRRRLA